MKIMYMVFHPELENKSNINRYIYNSIKDKNITNIRDMYSEYPDFKIDFEREKKLLIEHDRIVVQFPFYWYSAPALLKEWLDISFAYGFAYSFDSSKGVPYALAKKDFQIVTTVGGQKESYTREGHNNFSMDELLRPYEQICSLTHMNYLEPLIVNGVHHISDEDLNGFTNRVIVTIQDERKNIKTTK